MTFSNRQLTAVLVLVVSFGTATARAADPNLLVNGNFESSSPFTYYDGSDAGVADDVRQRLLHDPKRCQIDACRERPALAAHLKRDPDAGPGGAGYEAVEAVQVRQRHRDADHGERRHRGEHPGQVGGAARSGDQHAQAPARRRLAEGDHVAGGPVRRDDLALVRNSEFGQDGGGGAHGVPVRLASHDHAYETGFRAPG